MKISIHILMALMTVHLTTFNSIGQQKLIFESDLMTEKKPWTSLDFDNDPHDFQFAIVSDRAGSPRPGIFEDAVKKLNWLRPEFAISVGDLIEGVGREGYCGTFKTVAGTFRSDCSAANALLSSCGES